jgi:hypothetical protein
MADKAEGFDAAAIDKCAASSITKLIAYAQ